MVVIIYANAAGTNRQLQALLAEVACFLRLDARSDVLTDGNHSRDVALGIIHCLGVPFDQTFFAAAGGDGVDVIAYR